MHMKKYIGIIVIFLFCTLYFTACGKEVNPTGYLQSFLDSFYHEDYETFAEYEEVSVEEVKNMMRGEMEKAWLEEFKSEEIISDEAADRYVDMLFQIRDLAKYEVKTAEQIDSDTYSVTVGMEPADVYLKMEQAVKGVIEELMATEPVLDDMEVAEEAILEAMQRAIDTNSYGTAENIQVEVEIISEQYYDIPAEDVEKMETTLFPKGE